MFTILVAALISSAPVTLVSEASVITEPGHYIVTRDLPTLEVRDCSRCVVNLAGYEVAALELDVDPGDRLVVVNGRVKSISQKGTVRFVHVTSSLRVADRSSP